MGAYKIILYCEFLVEYLLVSILFKFIRHKFDLFHIVGDVSLTSAALVFCEKNKIPFIYEIVNEDNQKLDPLWIRIPFWRKKIKFQNNLATIKTINSRLEKKIKDNYPNIHSVSFPNSVDISKIEKARKQFDEKDKNNRKIIYLGKFIPRKRQDILIEALKYLPTTYTLDLCGPISTQGVNQKRDKLYLDRLISLIEELELTKRVKLTTKFIEDPYELISNYDVFVYPSRGEAFGTPIIEALMLGLPVVATKGEPAFEEWIADGQNGFLFDSSPIDLAKKIKDCSDLDNAIQENLRNKLRIKVSDEAADDFLVNEINRLVYFHDN